jgi:thioredoxin-like negative regulator of GroEL
MKEFQALYPDDPEGLVYLAEVLIKTGSKEEARSVLLKTVNSNDKYYADWAKRLLADL